MSKLLFFFIMKVDGAQGWLCMDILPAVAAFFHAKNKVVRVWNCMRVKDWSHRE